MIIVVVGSGVCVKPPPVRFLDPVRFTLDTAFYTFSFQF